MSRILSVDQLLLSLLGLLSVLLVFLKHLTGMLFGSFRDIRIRDGSLTKCVQEQISFSLAQIAFKVGKDGRTL